MDSESRSGNEHEETMTLHQPIETTGPLLEAPWSLILLSPSNHEAQSANLGGCPDPIFKTQRKKCLGMLKNLNRTH